MSKDNVEKEIEWMQKCMNALKYDLERDDYSGIESTARSMQRHAKDLEELASGMHV